MNAIDRLALNWQFESFTEAYQESCYKQMIYDFAKAWHFKRNRFWIKKTLDRFAKVRPDLDIVFTAKMWMPDFGMKAETWKIYAPAPKPEVYIGPDAFRQM